MTARQVLDRLRLLAEPRAAARWRRLGLDPAHCLGVPMAQVQRLARTLPRSHELARALWDLGLHEARLLAALVEEPATAEDEQLDRWVSGADHHDLSDLVALRVARASVFARTKVADWKEHPRELVRRSAYVLLGDLAATDRAMTDADFIPHVDAISTTVHLEAPLVREAMVRALVRIARRNGPLRRRALDALGRIGADRSVASMVRASRRRSPRRKHGARGDQPDAA
jgi:3-methyladenine DNA glycosylase AlkD